MGFDKVKLMLELRIPAIGVDDFELILETWLLEPNVEDVESKL